MKVKLTEEEVLEIFAQRAQVNSHRSNAMTSKELAIRYRVSERTIRDIWSRRTRRDLTLQSWTAEEHLSTTQMRQGRPVGAKDGVPRQRQPAQASEFTLSSSSDTTSEDCSPQDSISSTDCESSQGQADPQRMTASSMQPPRNGLLFNQAVLALLRQGIQQPPPGAPGAPGATPTGQSSQFHSLQQNFPNVFDAVQTPAVNPFTSSQPGQSSLFNSSVPPASQSLQQTSSAGPPRPVLHLSNPLMHSPQVPPFAPTGALALQSQPQQAPSANLSQGSRSHPQPPQPPSQLLELLNSFVPPSPERNIKPAQNFPFRFPPSSAANQAPAQAPPQNFALASRQRPPPFNDPEFMKRLPNGGIVPGGEPFATARREAAAYFPSAPLQQRPQQQPQPPPQNAPWAGAWKEVPPM
mmetsp:Transcript_1407/g.3092  ORF Transcript_1407/g.3092 Transcript_1407/m.3092 type:complete len:409 (+) Transcript_1407:72-1298(+)